MNLVLIRGCLKGSKSIVLKQQPQYRSKRSLRSLQEETFLLLRSGYEGVLVFRIPGELFRERERLSLEAYRKKSPAGPETLWTKRYEVRWVEGSPRVEPVPD